MGSMAQTSCASLLVMMVAMYCLIAVVATGTVPGVKWSHLEVWENSAAHDVWTRPHEYLDFRTYVLSTLGDMGFLDHLIEDYGDEWLTKVMYHYRWHHRYRDAIAKASNMLPLMSDNQMDAEQHRVMSEFIAERQMGRTSLVGSTDANRDVIEESFVRLLTLLEDHFSHFQFLLGPRPSRADFGLFGQFSQLFFWEPDSALLAAKCSPRSVIWAYQIDDLSSLEIDDTQSWFNRDSLPDSLSKLLHEIGRTYAPFLLANERSLLEGETELSCLIHGHEYKQSPFPYQLKCLNWIREAFETLQQEEQKAVLQILEGTGCELLLREPDA